MKKANLQQTRLIRQLQSEDPTLLINWDEVRGVAGSIRGKFIVPKIEGGEGKALVKENSFNNFLVKFAPLFGPANLAIEQLKVLRKKKDDLGWIHIVYQHMLQLPEQKTILEVCGSKLAAHFDAQGNLIEVQSSLWRDIIVDSKVQVNERELRTALIKKLESLKSSKDMLDRIKSKEENFPLTSAPRLVIYPWRGSFPLAWSAYGYGLLSVDDKGHPIDVPRIAYGHMLIDATTGEQIVFSPTLQSSETADNGSGLAVTPLTGTHTNRSLNVVHVGTTSTYRLKDTTHNRNIVTFDVACDASLDYDYEIGPALANNTLPVSEDTDGDKNWNRLPTNTTAAQRTSGQQPEVDAHHMIRQQYEWYHALAGRNGWDDGNYPNPPTPPQTINVLAHCRWPGGSCQENNAYKWSRQVGGLWRFWLAFMDGDSVNYDYMAGSRFIVSHEYQHAITDFSLEDGAGNPGLPYSDWLGAVHEGLSDVFGGLASEQWRPGTDISPTNLIFRNLAYPRDSSAYDSNKLDHFDDRNTKTGFYDRGTILAHCAYLIGNGGVHRRSIVRSPELIPVYGLGRETIGGISFLKAARIWYRAVSFYFSTHGALTGIPANDENSFRTLREGCFSAACDLYGIGSAEHLNTILAFYAVGLHPVGLHYGTDVTFLRWGIAWDLSRNYVGLSCPDYQSLDLFINNGGSSEWNALINVIDPATSQPTQFENTIYCRVRNVGDLPAAGVKVEFFYAKAGTAITTWMPVMDKNGAVQTLNIGPIGSGQSTFPDSDQNTPPSFASVKWYIPPLASGETVDHFCLRAVVSCSNDVNPYNNDVQSNISYAAYSPEAPAGLAFMVGNPLKEQIPVQLKINASLPKGWSVEIDDKYKDMVLKPGEERPVTISVKMGPGADKHLELPLDGDLKGQMYGHISGPFTGVLTRVVLEGQNLRGDYSARLPFLGAIVGKFEGIIDLNSGKLKGKAIVADPCSNRDESTCVGIDAYLRPWRRINISQWRDKELLGGITIQIQIPRKDETFAFKPNSTATKVATGK